MNKLKDAIHASSKLLNVSYKIKLGRKSKLDTLILDFEEDDFHHLLGIHYLKDLFFSENISVLMKRIFQYNDKMLETIVNSDFYHKIQTRLDCIIELEDVFDNKAEQHFKFVKNTRRFSTKIKYNYLIKNNCNHYFVIRKNNEEECKINSLFKAEGSNYTLDQSPMTLVYLSKNINGDEIELFDNRKR